MHHIFALRHFNVRARLRRLPLYACFVDIQKACDYVQHNLLWARLRRVGVSGRMLRAIQSLYTTGTLSIQVGGTAGQPGGQHVGVRQGCPLSPTLFGIFFDGLYEHFCTMLPGEGLILGFGHRDLFLCYADDVVLLAETGPALQSLIDSMHLYCTDIGFTISVAKTEVVIFHGSSLRGTWSVGGQILPRAESFKYLGIVSHESGDLGHAFRKLHQASIGARARLMASFGRMGCVSSFAMKRRLFATLISPVLLWM